MSQTDADERLFAGRSGRLLVVLAVGSMTGMTGRLVLSPLLPAIMADLAVTPFLAGIALSAMWAASALVQYPGGRASDQWSRKTVVVLAFGLLLVGSALLGQTRGYPGFVAGVIAVGVGAGLSTPATFAMLADLYAARRGGAFSVNTAALNLGGVVAAGLATGVLLVASWRLAFLPVVVVLAAAIAAMHRWSDEPYAVSRPSFDVRAAASRIVGTSRVRLMLLTTALVEFTWQSTASFLPTFLQVEKGASVALANNAFAGVFAIGVLANPVMGRLGDRFGYHPVATLASALAVTGLVAVLVASSTPALLAAIAVFAVGLTGFWPVMLAALMAAFPDASMGGDLGVTRTVYVGFGSLGSAYVGFVAGRASYTLAFGGLAVLLAANTVLALWLLGTRAGAQD